MAAKNWAKKHSKETLVAINGELSTVLKGGDPVEAIKNIRKHLRDLDKITKPPKTEVRPEPPKSRLPAPLRKRIENAIKRNDELIEAIKQWDPNT